MVILSTTLCILSMLQSERAIALSLFCTHPTIPSCATYTWPGAGLTDYVSDTAIFVSYVYTVGIWGEAEDWTILLATQIYY